jgi:hypothetical protein
MDFIIKDDDKRMRKSRRRLVILGILVVFFIGIQVLNSSFNFSANVESKEDLVDNEILEEKKELEELKTSISYGENSFSDVGEPQNVSLFHSLNQTFINNRTSDGGITIEDQTGLGWNMTDFELNFSHIYTTNKEVQIQTRVDEGDIFNSKDSQYINSFKIPNTCYIRNIYSFIQIPGPQNTGNNHSFRLTIYNSTLNSSGVLIPDQPLHNSSDETLIDLTYSSEESLPAKWYQANFTNRKLDISKTKNNTFFTFFEVLSWKSKYEGFYFYAYDSPEDKYESKLMKRISLDSNFTELTDTTGDFKLNLAPIYENPNANQINLTVCNDPVNENGLYKNISFLQSDQSNEFSIPISSLWFADVNFNVSFSGNFRFDTQSSNRFNATEGKDVLWNSSLKIIHYPDEGYDYKARFYKAFYWNYNNTYNGTSIFNDDEVSSLNSDFIEIFNASNHRWSIFYNQTNAILGSNVQGSSNKNLWYTLTDRLNITDYINASFSSKNSNGNARLRIISDGYTKNFEQNITSDNTFFDLWRVDKNTTITQNNTEIRLNILTENGTMAGIKTYSLKTELSEMDITLKAPSEGILKNEQYNFNFTLKNMYNSESISIDSISIKYERSPNEWVNLIKDYHYNLYSNHEEGIYNISINTELSEFLAGTYKINFTFSEGNKYFFSKLYNESLVIQKRTLNMTILESTHTNRIYTLGSSPNYTLYLNDSITNEGISDLEFEIFSTNLSESSKFGVNYFTVHDQGDGNYNITINTDTIYSENNLDNLTLEFRASKEGVYNSIAKEDELLIFHEEYHDTNLTIIERSPEQIVFGQSLWIYFELEDIDITSSDSGLTDGEFILKKDGNEISNNYYFIEDLNNGRYNMTVEMTPFNFEQISLTLYADRPENKTIGDNRIAYESSNINFEFTYSRASFSVNYNKMSTMYVNDTVSRLSLEISSNGGFIETADFDVSLGPNLLSVVSLGKGDFQVYMDSTDLNISETYEFSMNIQKNGYIPYSDKFNITITPYDANIQIPENFQGMTVYQQQTIRLISILSNTFTEREILNADVRMIINGTDIYSDNFTQLANKNGWYEGTLNVGDVSPGNHSLIIEIKAENYTPKNASTSIFILERAETSLNITEEFKKVYIWGDVLAIPVSLTSNNNPMSNTTITFQITETFTGGELSTESFILSTNEEGIARFEHVIPEGVQNIEILISFRGTNSLRPKDVSITDLSFRSPAEQTFLNVLPFIPLMIGGIVGISGFAVYKVIQRRKKVEKWKEKAQAYKDAQNVRFMLVLDKMSGQPIIQQDFGETGYDGSLIGGLLQAMTNFLHGLQKKEPGAGDKTSMLFDYKENEILIQDGEFSRGVLMLNEVPSEETKKSLTKFVHHFEERYEEHLQPFKGNLRVFNGYRELLDNYCKTHLLKQFHVSREPPEKELDAFHEKVLSISKTFELISRKNFDLNSLIDYVKSKVEDVLEDRIIAVIIDLISEGFLEPIPKEKGDNLK